MNRPHGRNAFGNAAAGCLPHEGLHACSENRTHGASWTRTHVPEHVALVPGSSLRHGVTTTGLQTIEIILLRDECRNCRPSVTWVGETANADVSV